MTLAVLRSPEGTTASIKRRLVELRQSEKWLLQRAGVSPQDWANFQAALAGVDGETFRRVLSVVGLHIEVKETPGPADFVGQVPHGRVLSKFGPLG